MPFGGVTGQNSIFTEHLAWLLRQCRDELDGLREDIAWSGGNRVADDLGTRLRRTTDRLETAIGAFSRLDRIISQNAAGAAAAPILAREARHRTRDGLTAVVALLHHQAASTPDHASAAALRAAGARVAVVTTLHACLGDISPVRGNDRPVDLPLYLRALCEAIMNAMDTGTGRAVIEIAVEPLCVTPNIAQSLGMVTCELVTNALRHAFGPGQLGRISVVGEGLDAAYLLSVEDDGRGLPHRFDHRARQPGVGMRLITTIVEQLQGRLMLRSCPGARCTLILPQLLLA